MKNAMTIMGMVIAGIFTVILVIDKIYQWCAASKLLTWTKRYERIIDKGFDYLEDQLD